jgi:hypothetical protein
MDSTRTPELMQWAEQVRLLHRRSEKMVMSDSALALSGQVVNGQMRQNRSSPEQAQDTGRQRW